MATTKIKTAAADAPRFCHIFHEMFPNTGCVQVYSHRGKFRPPFCEELNITINPNPVGWGLYDFRNFEQVLLHNALNNKKNFKLI